jgi:hypothetical protein
LPQQAAIERLPTILVLTRLTTILLLHPQRAGPVVPAVDARATLRVLAGKAADVWTVGSVRRRARGTVAVNPARLGCAALLVRSRSVVFADAVPLVGAAQTEALATLGTDAVCVAPHDTCAFER